MKADFWKSQAKKFCDFCKCWIADNKPSIEFHENGKRHKENVTKRLSEIGKRSQQEQKKNLKVNEEMKKMEEAAFEAYMKDVEADADLTSQLIKGKLAQRQQKNDNDSSTTSFTELSDKIEKSGSVAVKSESIRKVANTKIEILQWFEAKSDEGHTYYWNMETGESRWEAPEEAYVTLTEQRKKKQLEERCKEREEAECMKRKEEEERARLEREKMKQRRLIETNTKPPEPYLPILGPAPRPEPYGVWKPVQIRTPDPVDLQLPGMEYVKIKVPTAVEPQVKFKEKMISNIDDDGNIETGFKKRKFSSKPIRNMRRRVDQDD